MLEIKNNIEQYLIPLLGKEKKEISTRLNLEETYINSQLRKLKIALISTKNPNNLVNIKLIDKSLGISEKKYKEKEKFKMNNKELIIDLLKNTTDEELMEKYGLQDKQLLGILSDLYNNVSYCETQTDFIIASKINEYVKRLKNKVATANKTQKPADIIYIPSEKIELNKDNKIIELNTLYNQILDMNTNTLSFIVISDTHYGSYFENMDYLDEVYEFASKHGIKYIFHCGDLIEGTYSDYARCKEEYKSINTQLEHLLNDYCFDKSIKNIVLLGNHDLHAFLDENINLNDVLKQREDFVPLGYKSAYVKVGDKYINLKHSITRIIDKTSGISPILDLSGHSHQYSYTTNNTNVKVKVPTLSSMRINNSVVNNGFLVCEMIDEKDETYMKIDFIDLRERGRKLVLEGRVK